MRPPALSVVACLALAAPAVTHAQAAPASADTAPAAIPAPAVVAPAVPAEPPKDADHVIVVLRQPPAQAYRAIAQALALRGYTLQQSDAAAGVITTAFRTAPGVGPVQIQVVVADDSAGTRAVLNGNLQFMGPQAMPIRYGGARWSARRKAWDELAAVGAAVPGATVTYRKGT
jgi:hypothetical protein